jgi:hypothetical protein
VWILVIATLAVGLGYACQSLIGLKDRRLSGEGGTSTASNAGQSGAAKDGGVVSKTCKTYCDDILGACTDADNHSQFYAAKGAPPNRAACENVCSIFEAAGKTDTSKVRVDGGSLTAVTLSKDNTMVCRAKEALHATQIEPDVQCPFAGPGGADTCGSNCESYCYLMSRACAMFPQFQNDDCVTKCGALRDLTEETLKPGESSLDATRDHEGDTVQCRIVHVASATVAPETHCWHAQLAPHSQEGTLNPCAGYLNETAPRCEDYCRITNVACTPEEGYAVYESKDQCMKVCQALDPGTLMDEGGKPNVEDNNNVGCRKSHAYNALLIGAEAHCPHAGPAGAGVCGSNCASYCTLLEKGCAAQFKQEYGTGSGAGNDCQTACEKVDGHDKKDYAVSKAGNGPGQAFACRLLSVTRALGTPGEPAFCEAALGHVVCP